MTLSRQASGLNIHKPVRKSPTDVLHLVADSAGLKLLGAGEWLLENHGTTKRRAWHKLHIGIDAYSGEIFACDLTDKDMDDASRGEPLLEKFYTAPDPFMADGAYDRIAVHDAVIVRSMGALLIVLPCKGAVLGPTVMTEPTKRDENVLDIKANRRSN